MTCKGSQYIIIRSYMFVTVINTMGNFTCEVAIFSFIQSIINHLSATSTQWLNTLKKNRPQVSTLNGLIAVRTAMN